MDENMQDGSDVLEGIAFVGETLGPFFLQDPKTGEAGAAFQALAALDVDAAAAEWPFAEEAEAHGDLALMKEGLARGVEDDDLVWEYRRLFVGPAPKPAPPWGSVYTDRECVVFGESTLALRAWMRALGIERLVDDKTPEDHIGLMLVLMAWIARNQPADLDDYLRLHLLSHRLVVPNALNLEGLFGMLTNVVWTSEGPCTVAGFEETREAVVAK